MDAISTSDIKDDFISGCYLPKVTSSMNTTQKKLIRQKSGIRILIKN